MKKNIILSIVCILILVSFAGCFEEEKKSENNDSSDDNVNTQLNDSSDDNVSTQLNVTTTPFLWKIEGETPSYLFGTVHLKENEILTLPDIVFETILSSDYVFTETKMDYSTLINNSYSSMLSGGKTIDDYIPSNISEKLDNFFSRKGLSKIEINALKSMKIWAVASSVVVYSDSDKEDMYQPILDQYIWNIATQNGINSAGIETAEEQLNIFNNLTLVEQIKYLNDSLNYVIEIENNGQYYVDMYQNEYLEGNINSIIDLEYAEFNESDPFDQKLEKLLLTNRNIKMTNRIIDNITKNPDKQYFFAFGTAHFAGDECIINLLEDEGYSVTRVSFDKCDLCSKDEVNIEGRCYIPYSDEYRLNFT